MTESTPDLQNRSAGDIAAQLPGATSVMREFGIDFCCQGHVSLAEAAAHRNVDLGRLCAALDRLDPTAKSDAPDGTAELIEHIQTRYHDGLRRQVPEMAALSRKVESVHFDHPKVPAGLSESLKAFLGEMEVHMKKEELLLFPAMRKGMAEGLSNRLREMRHDHNAQADFLDQMERLTDDYTLPADACASWNALYSEALRLRADLTKHIHLENNVLFPRFETETHA